MQRNQRRLEVEGRLVGLDVTGHRANGGRAALEPRVCPLGRELVGYGFRGWLTGLREQDFAAWDRVWMIYSRRFGTSKARDLVTALGIWVGTVQNTACRRVEVSEPRCARFCEDECIAISIIALAQKEPCPAMRACAFALLGSSEIDGMLESAERYAAKMHAAGCSVELEARTPVNVLRDVPKDGLPLQ